MYNLDNDIEKILFSQDVLKKRCKELGEELSEIYKDSCPIVTGVLKGASVFFADLVRELKCDLVFDFITVSSYGLKTTSSGVINMRKDFDNDITGKDILIVEDIVDSGFTLKYLKNLLYERKANSVRTVALLNKYECHPRELDTDFYGFKIENEFVVGYGLDYAGRYRNLPYVGILKRSVYEKKDEK
ncbi:MAG: hypoxanthine phosphoribosyltransferase [Lachnospiraceae bacterium]|nr:hypoxanthine phosphoribosyltransferase [Lachnospiraceae bacterium]